MGERTVTVCDRCDTPMKDGDERNEEALRVLVRQDLRPLVGAICPGSQAGVKGDPLETAAMSYSDLCPYCENRVAELLKQIFNDGDGPKVDR